MTTDFPLDAAGREDRGTPVYVWVRGFAASFCPFVGATERVTLSVPIGWRLVTNSSYGIVLGNTFGAPQFAVIVHYPTIMKGIGFRIRAREPVEVDVISQVVLIRAITRNLDKQGLKVLNERRLNAIIDAANTIIRECEQPDAPAVPGSGLAAWLRSDDTGLSSRALARHLGRVACPEIPVRGERSGWDNDSHPCDPADFGRCLRLLEAVPELCPHLGRMADVSPSWSRLVAAWDHLEALYREEFPRGKAPKLLAAMSALTDPEVET